MCKSIKIVMQLLRCRSTTCKHCRRSKSGSIREVTGFSSTGLSLSTMLLLLTLFTVFRISRGTYTQSRNGWRNRTKVQQYKTKIFPQHCPDVSKKGLLCPATEMVLFQ